MWTFYILQVGPIISKDKQKTKLSFDGTVKISHKFHKHSYYFLLQFVPMANWPIFLSIYDIVGIMLRALQMSCSHKSPMRLVLYPHC